MLDNSKSTSESSYLTFADLQKHFGGVSRSWLYLQIEARSIPKPTKVGGKQLWHRAAIRAFDERLISEQIKLVGAQS
jgi:predicted DNA-binding transcriptional regulator AlpA